MSAKSPIKTKKKTTNLVVPIDSELKEKVKNILAQIGLNQSQFIVAAFKEVARTNKIPLSFDLNDAWKNARPATEQEAKAIDNYLANPQVLSAEETKEFLDELKAQV